MNTRLTPAEMNRSFQPVSIALPFPPTVNTYYTVARGRKILSKRGREFKTLALQAMRGQLIEQGLSGRFQVLIDAYPPDRRRRDLDNIVKPIFDALTEYGLFEDDSQIDDFRVVRQPKQGWWGVNLTINAIEQALDEPK